MTKQTKNNNDSLIKYCSIDFRSFDSGQEAQVFNYSLFYLTFNHTYSNMSISHIFKKLLTPKISIYPSHFEIV